MVEFSEFPTEILTLIASYIRALAVLNALGQTCRKANAAIHSRLYRQGRRHALCWAALNGQVATLKHVIAASKAEIDVSVLLFACKQQHTNFVAELLRLDYLRDAAISFPEGRSDNSPLYYACEKGRLETVELLMALPGNNHTRHSGSNDATPLHAATFYGHLDIMRLLLDSGADINACTNDGVTALYYAAYRVNADAFDLLLERGADIDGGFSRAKRPLMIALEYGKTEIVRKLLGKGANPNGTEGPTPLQTAIEKDTDEPVRLLLEYGADPNAQTGGFTALQIAFQCASRYICEELLSYGARIPETPPGLNHPSPIRLACERGNTDLLQLCYDLDPEKYPMQETYKALLHICRGPEVVQFLVDRGHEVDELDANGETALARHIFRLSPRQCCCCHVYAAIKSLIDNGADVSVRTAGGKSLLCDAITRLKDSGLAQLLIESGADIQRPRGNENKDTLLHCLADFKGLGSVVLAEMLIANGLDVSSLGEEGYPAVVHACKERNFNLLKVLIAHGADVDYYGKDLGSLLHIVVVDGFSDPEAVAVTQCMTTLVEAGLSLNEPVHNGLTPFQTAIFKECYIDDMVHRGGDVNMYAIYGQHMVGEEQVKYEEISLLHAFALIGYKETGLRWLLDHGADVKAIDSRERTALHVAAYHSRNQRNVDLLLEFGSDPKAKDDAGNEAGKVALGTEFETGNLCFYPKAGLIYTLQPLAPLDL